MAEEKDPQTEASPPPKEGASWRALWQRLSQNRLLSILSTAIVIGVVGWVAYRQYLASQNEECLKEMRAAEAFFRQDSFEKAIKGTATVLGFEQLVNDYGRTQAGNLCRLYLGLCYLKTGQPQAAIETLEDYDAPDSYLGGAALAALAGAYAEVKEFEKAARYYQKAAQIHDNSQTSPAFLLQAGLCYELAGQWEKAAQVYAEITEEYPLAAEAPTAQKHLARVEAHAK
ncbi:MAG: hypothetical protein D6750_02010 [Bacteroidetes bacterium]|nr:MAG: hypothetical protein D6750_02010 [Bacteroidota bacterium]